MSSAIELKKYNDLINFAIIMLLINILYSIQIARVFYGVIDMPTTISSILIMIFAILPGWPAYLLYKKINGVKWGEPEWIKFVNIVGLSLFGLILYNLFFPIANFPPPLYVFPTTFTPESFTLSMLPNISIALITHCVFSVLAATAIIFLVKGLSRWSRTSVYPSVWDEFIRSKVKEHWVVVTLNNNEAYAGYIYDADCSVSTKERDIILNEPAKFDEVEQNYYSLPYQNLFLQSDSICSIATIYQDGDIRKTDVSKFLFVKECKPNE